MAMEGVTDELVNGHLRRKLVRVDEQGRLIVSGGGGGGTVEPSDITPVDEGTVLGRHTGAGDGDAQEIPFSHEADPDTIVARDPNGRIEVADGVGSLDAVNFSQLDTKADKDNTWSPTDYGFATWSFDLINAANSAELVDGEMFVVRLKIQSDQQLNRVHYVVSQSGSSLTNAYAAIYQDGALLGQSDNSSTAFQSVGGKTITFSTPVSVVAGYIDVGLWVTGTSMPSVGRAGQLSGTADFLTGANARYATADTGLTTTAPATLGTKTASQLNVWTASSLV